MQHQLRGARLVRTDTEASPPLVHANTARRGDFPGFEWAWNGERIGGHVLAATGQRADLDLI